MEQKENLLSVFLIIFIGNILYFYLTKQLLNFLSVFLFLIISLIIGIYYDHEGGYNGSNYEVLLKGFKISAVLFIIKSLISLSTMRIGIGSGGANIVFKEFMNILFGIFITTISYIYTGVLNNNNHF